jgi:hypothetical protein
MIESKTHKRKTPPKHGTASLPAGVKVVPAPKRAARRKLLSGPDIATSGGCHTVHAHPVGRYGPALRRARRADHDQELRLLQRLVDLLTSGPPTDMQPYRIVIQQSATIALNFLSPAERDEVMRDINRLAESPFPPEAPSVYRVQGPPEMLVLPTLDRLRVIYTVGPDRTLAIQDIINQDLEFDVARGPAKVPDPDGLVLVGGLRGGPEVPQRRRGSVATPLPWQRRPHGHNPKGPGSPVSGRRFPWRVFLRG